MNVSVSKSTAWMILVNLLLLPAMQGCDQEGSSEYSSEAQYYRSAQLSNIYDNEIAPLSSELVEKAGQLERMAMQFELDPTAENLEAIRGKWKAAELTWKQLELYDLGMVAESFVSFEINRWPTDTGRIEANISGSDTIDEEYIASLGSSSKGVSGIEYILYSSGDSTEVLNTFTSGENTARRLAYLRAMSQNLVTKITQYRELWESQKEVFLGSLEHGISGSQNQVINAMVSLTEEIIISKLGNALGDSNGGITDPKHLEAYRSHTSKEILRQHLTSLKRCYQGDFALTPFRVGFDDFLVLIGSEALSTEIADRFADCQLRLDAIPGSLEEALTKDPGGVEALKDSFRELLILIKVDMANVLGSTITFNDNDGD